MRANSSLAYSAYSSVRQRIISGELRLGEVISRRQIAAELGMSFLPVSEALLRLEAEGLLESRPRTGTRVRIPSPEDFDGSYVLREALETHAATLFSQRATEEQKARLRQLAAEVDSLAGSQGEKKTQYLALHERLHRSFAEEIGCTALAEAISQAHVRASVWMCVGHGGLSQPRRHQELVEAICTLPANEVPNFMREHVRAGQANALERLQPFFGRRDNAYTRRTAKSAARAPLPAMAQ